jgi:hypothetical protein
MRMFLILYDFFCKNLVISLYSEEIQSWPQFVKPYV